MGTEFLQSNLWAEIRRISKRAKRRRVAVAYLGTGASSILPLRKGDDLIVDMTIGTVRAGQTNPYEIDEYFKRGVNIYSCPNLHAKIFLFDRTAVVGSNNISKHGENVLFEAAVATTEKKTVSRVRGFLKSLRFLPVEHKWISICKKAYHPPRFRSFSHDPTSFGSRLWIAATWPTEFTGTEGKMVAREEKKAAKQIKQKKDFEPNTIRFWGDKSRIAQLVKPDDLIIEICHESQRPVEVFPPARVLSVKRYKKFNQKGPRTCVLRGEKRRQEGQVEELRE